MAPGILLITLTTAFKPLINPLTIFSTDDNAPLIAPDIIVSAKSATFSNALENHFVIVSITLVFIQFIIGVKTFIIEFLTFSNISVIDFHKPVNISTALSLNFPIASIIGFITLSYTQLNKAPKTVVIICHIVETISAIFL